MCFNCINLKKTRSFYICIKYPYKFKLLWSILERIFPVDWISSEKKHESFTRARLYICFVYVYILFCYMFWYVEKSYHIVSVFKMSKWILYCAMVFIVHHTIWQGFSIYLWEMAFENVIQQLCWIAAYIVFFSYVKNLRKTRWQIKG